MAKRTKSQRELEFDLQARKIDRVAMVIETAIKYGAVLGIFGFVYLSISSLAGQTTLADVGIRFIGQIGVSEALAWALAGGAGFYGYRQRKLRQDTIEGNSGRIRRLETERDPNRSSSKLSPRGTTRPEDLRR